MKRLLSSLGIAILLSASMVLAQNPNANQKTPSQGPTTQNEATNPQGGSPNSPVPGRVTGDTPTRVQTALDKQLPKNAEVVASVTDDGRVKLTGTVQSEGDKVNAEKIARGVTNKDVNNQIQVKSSNPR